MADKQIDVSPETQRINAEKLKRKLELRNEFLKLKTDPFRHALNEGGTVFDPGYLRFQSLNVHLYNFFKPSPKSIFQGLAFFVIPSSLYFYWMYTSRRDREASFRRGEVAYADRTHKLAS